MTESVKYNLQAYRRAVRFFKRCKNRRYTILHVASWANLSNEAALEAVSRLLREKKVSRRRFKKTSSKWDEWTYKARIKRLKQIEIPFPENSS